MKYMEEPVVIETKKTLILEDEEADAFYNLIGAMSRSDLLRFSGEKQSNILQALYKELYHAKAEIRNTQMKS